MSDRKNYYDVLEIPVDATPEQIQKAYTRSRNAYSQDSVAMYSLLSPQECEVILNEVEEGYSILSVPEKRREYDKVRGLRIEQQATEDREITNQIHRENTTTEMAQARPQMQAGHSHTQTQSNPNPNVDNMFNHTGPKKDENFQFSDDKAKENIYEDARSHQDVLKFGNESTNSNVQVAKFSALAKYQLDFDVDNAFEEKIENCDEFTGAFLKEIREYKKVSIERLADMTKISKTQIRNLENDDFEKLPAVVYTRGFSFQIAKALRLNADLVCNSFMNYRKKSLNQLDNQDND
jgi:curved DNA-binding protein CbpA